MYKLETDINDLQPAFLTGLRIARLTHDGIVRLKIKRLPRQSDASYYQSIMTGIQDYATSCWINKESVKVTVQ